MTAIHPTLLVQLFGTDGIPEWRLSALCAQSDPDAFFPASGGSVAIAKRICRGCEVRVECLRDALENGDEHGVFGGLSPRERRGLGHAA